MKVTHAVPMLEIKHAPIDTSRVRVKNEPSARRANIATTTDELILAQACSEKLHPNVT